jgi:hypothetical protein
MSAYNPPTETLPRFNTAVFIQDANVTYPVAQGALTIPKQIRIVDGSNTIIITPTSIIINGIVYSLSNIAYLDLSQTFTGVNTFTQNILTNTIKGRLTTDNISLYDTSTNEISIGSGNLGNINIGSSSCNISLKGLNTFINGFALCNTLKSINSSSSVSLYEVPMVSLNMGNSTAPITITGLTNTINGNTTITNTLFGNTIRGKLTTDNISLYDTSTNEISIGSGNSGNINIGSSSCNISLKGTNTFINGIALCNTLKSINSSSSVSLYEVPMVSLNMGNSSTPNTITGYTNTINGNTIITNTLFGNTIQGKAVGDAISLYDTSTGIIKLGNSTLGTNTNTIYGITTFNQALNAPTPSSLINTSQVPTTAYLTTYYAPLTGTIANASAITLTPNTTDTLDYITFSSTDSGSSNIKTNTNLTFNASTGKLSASSLETNTIQGKAVGDNITLYNTSTGTISIGNDNVSTNIISGIDNTINGNTTIIDALYVNTMRSVAVGTTVNLFNNLTTGSIFLGSSLTSGAITIGRTAQTGAVTINGAITGGTNSIFNNSTTSSVNINNARTSGVLTIGNSSTTAVTANTNIHGTSVTGVNNLFTNTTTANSNILTNITSGTLTIGNATQTGAFTLYGSTSGTNTIFNNIAAGLLNIGTGLTSGGRVVMGTSSGTITLNGITSIIDTLDVNTIEGKAVGDSISLFNTSTGVISMGNSSLGTNTNNIFGITTFNQPILAPTPASLLNTTRVPTTAYLTTYYAPLTGTIANASAITLTPNTTNTLDYITFSSTDSGSSNIKTNTNLTFNASTGKLSASSLETNTIQGKAVGDSVTLYNNITTGIISIGTNNTSDINIGSSSGATSLKSLITYINGSAKCNDIQPNTSSSVVTLYTSPMTSLTIGNNTTSTTTIKGLSNTIFGDTSIINTLKGNTIQSVLTTDAISLYSLTTGGITLGNSSGTNTINGNTTITNTLFGNTLRGKAVGDNISLYTTTTTGTITLGNGTLSTNIITGSSNTLNGLANTITGLANTINGDTTITNTLFGNTLRGKAITDAISLYTTSTSGGITLGNTSNTNTINGDTIITNTLDVNSIQGKAVTDAISLYTTSTSGGITLGNTANTNTINGNTTMTNTLIVNTVHSIAAGTTTNLYNNLTTGSIVVGANLTSGAITIGRTAQTGAVTINGALTTGANSLFNNSTTSAVNINRARTSGVLTIGNSSTTAVTASTNIYGTSVTGTNNLFTNTTTADSNILTGVTTGDINIGTSRTTGSLTIGNSSTTAVIASTNIYGTSVTGANSLFTNTTTANSYILTSVTTGSINIGTGLDAFGRINIGSVFGENKIEGYTRFTSTIEGNTIRASTTSATVSLYTNVTASIVNFLTGITTGAINIGSALQTGNMTIYGSTTSSTKLFNNVTTGDITIGENGNDITIGRIDQDPTIYPPPDSNVTVIGTSLTLFGNLLRTVFYGGASYYLEGITYITTSGTLITPPFSKYYICTFATSGTIYLPAPIVQFKGIEIIIRYTNAVVTPTTIAGTNVFINLSNTVTSSLIATVSYRIVCAFKSNTSGPGGDYYWMQLY